MSFFSEIAHSHSYTDSYISSFWWVVNILFQKYTLPKKKNLMQKAAFLSLLWTFPIDLWCNMLENLEIQRKYRWYKIVSGTHFIFCSYLSIYFRMDIFCYEHQLPILHPILCQIWESQIFWEKNMSEINKIETKSKQSQFSQFVEKIYIHTTNSI